MEHQDKAIKYQIDELIKQGILEAIGDGVSIQDTNFKVLYQNQTHKNLMGEHLGEYCYKAYERRNAVCEGCPVDMAFKDGMSHTTERSAPVERGTIYVEITASPIRDSSGEIIASIEIVRDITEHKKAEELLYLERNRLKGILDAMPDGICKINQQYDIEYINPIMESQFGAIKGKPCYAYFHDRTEACPWCRNQEVFAGKTIRWEWYSFKTGMTYDLFDMPLLNADGSVSKLEIFHDITERKKAEEALQESEERFRQIAESTEEWIWEVNKDGLYTYASHIVEKILGYKPEEVVGKKHFYDFFPSDIREEMKKAAFKVFAAKEAFKRFVNSNLHKNGDIILIETSGAPILDSKGDLLGYRGIDVNITGYRKLEDQLRHAQKMEAIGTLAGGIAHDFNNMLNVIIGYASLMQMHMSHDDPKLEQVKEILNAGDRAAHLTRGLLTFSRKQVMEIRRINLNEIIEGFKKMLARIIGEDIELRIITSSSGIHNSPYPPLILRGGGEAGGVTPKDAELIIKADIVQIEQVLMNLAVNARDAMPKGGVLTIETMPVNIDSAFIRIHGYGEPGIHALIAVSDTGEGMDDKTRERIFEPFFTTKEVGRGTGLGLSIVYGIIKQHHGYINCYSEPGKGTTFKIYLPLIKEEAEKIEIAEAELPKGGTETILVAEDDAGVRSFIKQTLEGFGYKVIEAIDGEDAVKKFKDNKDAVQLCLFDMIMPRKNGKDAYEDIKGIRHDMRIIFTSGYAGDIIDRFGIKEGIECISKPVSPNELLRKVREALG